MSERSDPDWLDATRMFFTHAAWRGLRYQGIRIGKNPLDLWIYQELLERVRPALLIEFGTMCGASGLWFCHQLDRIARDMGGPAHARLISVEKSSRHTPPAHPRATWLKGRVLSDEIVAAVRAAAAAADGPVMISEDSNHSAEHVGKVLTTYAPLVTRGSYFVVEDAVLDTVMGQQDRWAPGAALEAFLRSPAGERFKPDHHCHKFGITFHPGGWLACVR